ncbi:MAG: ABC transporter ATP-binding protein [Thermodesulfobacteriota bacterium]
MIVLERVEKIYRRGMEEVHALREVDLVIGSGEFVAVVGPSGSGKTTLMQILGCLDTPTSGIIRIGEQPVQSMRESDLVQLRREKIGFVFQQFYLIPGLSVLDNVTLPLLFSRKEVERDQVVALIERVGLEGRLQHRPNQLSGGEMQRVAIARALVNRPELLLADEPTGNLDSANSEKIFSLLASLHGDGLTVVMVTHNPDLAQRADRVIAMSDGRIV